MLSIWNYLKPVVVVATAEVVAIAAVAHTITTTVLDRTLFTLL